MGCFQPVPGRFRVPSFSTGADRLTVFDLQDDCAQPAVNSNALWPTAVLRGKQYPVTALGKS